MASSWTSEARWYGFRAGRLSCHPGAVASPVGPPRAQALAGGVERLTSEHTFPVRKHELERAVQLGLAQDPRNFLLEFQIF